MSKQDQLVLILTAIVGFVCGLYIYVSVFRPVYVEPAPDLVIDSELAVIGEQYGGCTRLGCASFKLTSDRRYEYIPAGQFDLLTGRYPRVEFKNLTALIDQADLEFVASKTNPNNCQSFVDGIDYRFVITQAGIEYDLDTCGTRLASDPELNRVLERIFTVLQNPDEYSYGAADYQSAGVIGYLFPELFR